MNAKVSIFHFELPRQVDLDCSIMFLKLEPAFSTIMGKRERGEEEGSKGKREGGGKHRAVELEVWWARMRNLSPDAYAAGKVLDLSVPTELEALRALRGPDVRTKKLFVRRDFDPLFCSLVGNGGRQTDWLGHINGNSGVGKSAFFWYFIIRIGVEMRGISFRIVYQSGNYIWEFCSSGEASVVKKTKYPSTSLANATWHLVNQRVEPGDPLGPRVLVAASPERANLKTAKPDRMISTFYVYPWEEDEFGSLVGVWLEAADAAEQTAAKLQELVPEPEEDQHELKEADKLREVYLLNGEQLDVAAQDLELVAEQLFLESGTRKGPSFPARVWSVIRNLRSKADEIRVRAGAAELYFSWFGGVPRWLWQMDVRELNDLGFEKGVDASLSNATLPKIVQALRTGAGSDDVSWLLHFTRSSDDVQDYVLQFASSKVKYKFTSVLARTKDEELRTLMRRTDPQLGALRDYIFEQEVIGRILNTRMTAVFMTDDRHCQACSCRGDNAVGSMVKWIACDNCSKWYHQSCVGITAVLDMANWTCPHCYGKALPESVSSLKLGLRYYEGELKDALLDAGAAARFCVWRPLKKNNAVFDFVILPATLGQATTDAGSHPVPIEAVEDGVAALKAWNQAYNPGREPETYALTFFLMSTNFEGFGYQSYRKLQRVSEHGVKGISQVKVLVPTGREELAPHTCAVDIGSPSCVAETLDDLFQGPAGPASFEAMTKPEPRAVAKSWGMTGYSSLTKPPLISRLEAGLEEDRGFERKYYKETYLSICE